MFIIINMMLETKTKYNLPNFILPLLMVVICFMSILFIHNNSKMPELELTPQDTTIHFNEKLIKAFSLGQQRLLSSFLWSETLLKSDIKHYQKEDLNSWMFLRLRLITTLDPYFYVAYLYGGVYLSIIKDDLSGASYIYDKGLEIFPDDFDLHFNAAFHYYYEVGDYPKAINSLEVASKNPKAPSYFVRLLSRLKAEEGNIQDAYVIINSLYENSPEGSAIKKKHKKNLFFLKTELDLECLNSGKTNCSQLNPNGIPYIRSGDGWKSPEKWTPYRVKKRKKKK